MKQLVLTDNYGDEMELSIKNRRLYINVNSGEMEFWLDDARLLQDWLVKNIAHIDGGINNESR